MDFTSYEGFTFERREHGVLLVVIDRPEKYNALTESMHGDMARLWLDIDSDDATRAAVITGSGKAFCAGGDLEMDRRTVGDYGRVTQAMRHGRDIVLNMMNCEKPIISAINGVAVGAGLAVALLADISVIGDEVRLTDGHVRIGLVAGDHAALLWPLLCGLAKSKYYLLTGDFVDGSEAERMGLVSRCVPQAQVLSEALHIAERIATGPQHAVRYTKRSLNQWLRNAQPIFEASLALEMLTLFGDDSREGMEALVEKRPAAFGD